MQGRPAGRAYLRGLKGSSFASMKAFCIDFKEREEGAQVRMEGQAGEGEKGSGHLRLAKW